MYFESCVVANANKIIPCYYAACFENGYYLLLGGRLGKETR